MWQLAFKVIKIEGHSPLPKGTPPTPYTTQTAMSLWSDWPGMPEEPSPPSWAFVKAMGVDMDGPGLGSDRLKIHDTLFGFYTVEKTPTHYIFTLVQHPNKLPPGKKTVVPLSVQMGVGDFNEVTPEKIKS